MKLFIILAFYALSLATSGIHDHTINSNSGDEVGLNNFAGKKMLFVNIATGSPDAIQIYQLQQLQNQFAGTLVVIGFPSNSFGNEIRTNAQIREFCQNEQSASFLIAAKGEVKGSGMQPVYQWLTRKTENGELNSEVEGDFQKYLVDEQGELIGAFKGMVSPLDEQIVSLIR